MTDWTIEQADVVEWAKRYEGEKYHFLFCDPPYHLQEMTNRFGKDGSAPAQYGRDGAFRRMSKGFMGKQWDGGDVSFDPATWAAFLPLMHDGAFGAAYAASRNWHRMAVAIEDAGFFIHDTLFLWAQGQGMPKGSRVDRYYQEQRHGWDGNGMRRNAPAIGNRAMVEMSLQERLELWREERRWQGHRYGLQTLAPRVEPILIFQKPWSAGVQRDSIIATGAGCMNVDGCRVGHEDTRAPAYRMTSKGIKGGGYGSGQMDYDRDGSVAGSANGRWPSNFGLVHTPDCVWVGERRVKNKSGSVKGKEPSQPVKNVYGEYERVSFVRHADPDGFETVDDWACSPGCPARRLGEMSGCVGGKWGKQGKEGATGIFGIAATAKTSEPYIGDQGTAARFFPPVRLALRHRRAAAGYRPGALRGESGHQRARGGAGGAGAQDQEPGQPGRPGARAALRPGRAPQ